MSDGKTTKTLSWKITVRPWAPGDDLYDSRDGQSYKTVVIGSQCWTAENLKYVPPDAPSWCYDDDESWGAIYGRLYDFKTITADHHENGKDIAPPGWHVPTDEEWIILEKYLITNGANWDGTKSGNKIAKSLAAQSGWNPSIPNGSVGIQMPSNNSSGFSALPGGNRYFYGGVTYYKGYLGYWWSSTKADGKFALIRELRYDRVNLNRRTIHKNAALSVRLVRD